MGSGKSSVGAALAAKLGWEFTDLDSYVEHKAGKSIDRIFSEHGESVFRALEAEAVRDRIVMSEVEGFNLVLALGGGTLCINSVRPLILEHTECVWLKASAATVRERLSGTSGRPLFAPESVEKLLCEREPIYAQARRVVCTDSLGIDGVVEEISSFLTA